MLLNNDPIQFPVINLHALLVIPSPLIRQISEMKQELVQKANFLLRHPYLIYSPTIRFLFKHKAVKIEVLRSRLQNEGHRKHARALRLFRSKHST